NLCYKQMEQMEQKAPNGFKPNYKFEICKGCFKNKDYLNEFQICNSCYKWMEQMEQKAPSGFKPNYIYEECKRCYEKGKIYLNEFFYCNSCYNQTSCIPSGSGSEIIDNFIRHT